MGRYTIIPGSQRFVCGGNSAYGMVSVHDSQDTAHADSHIDNVRVDLTWADAAGSTPARQAHITLPDGSTENVDDAFLTAWGGLQRVTGGGTTDQQAYCRDNHADAPAAPAAPAAREPVNAWWLLIPTGTRLLGYTARRLSLDSLRQASPDASLTGTMNGVSIGLDAATTVTYQLTNPDMSDTAWYVSNGGLLLWSGVMCGVAFGASGNNHGPELHECAGGPLDIASSAGYRYLHTWGVPIELALGGAAIGLGFAVPGTRTLTPSTMAVPGTIPPGSRGVAGNPLSDERFPASRIDFIGLGATHVANALLIQFPYRAITGRPPPPTAPRLSVTTLPEGGAFASVYGVF